MPDASKKKPWSTPELRKLELTDELLDLFARQARDKARMPIKRAK